MRNHLLIFLLGILLMAGLALYAKEDLANVDMMNVLILSSSSSSH